MMTMRKSLIASLALGLMAAYAGDADIAAFQVGKTIMGPPATAGSLTGNVVMVEFWGTH